MKNEKLFEQSEFFSFRKFLHFLALEREPAPFLFCFFFLSVARKKKKITSQQDYATPYPHAELPIQYDEP